MPQVKSPTPKAATRAVDHFSSFESLKSFQLTIRTHAPMGSNAGRARPVNPTISMYERRTGITTMTVRLAFKLNRKSATMNIAKNIKSAGPANEPAETFLI
jgi:hypothetical protein